MVLVPLIEGSQQGPVLNITGEFVVALAIEAIPLGTLHLQAEMQRLIHAIL